MALGRKVPWPSPNRVKSWDKVFKYMMLINWESPTFQNQVPPSLQWLSTNRLVLSSLLQQTHCHHWGVCSTPPIKTCHHDLVCLSIFYPRSEAAFCVSSTPPPPHTKSLSWDLLCGVISGAFLVPSCQDTLLLQSSFTRAHGWQVTLKY